MCVVVSWRSKVGWIVRVNAIFSRLNRWKYMSVTKLGPITDTGSICTDRAPFFEL